MVRVFEFRPNLVALTLTLSITQGAAYSQNCKKPYINLNEKATTMLNFSHSVFVHTCILQINYCYSIFF